MRDFEREKQFLLPYVDNDRTVFGDVQLRLPDLVLDSYLELDLGGRVVSSTTLVMAIRPATPSSMCPRPASRGRAT
jgi:hypothetical protein